MSFIFFFCLLLPNNTSFHNHKFRTLLNFDKLNAEKQVQNLALIFSPIVCCQGFQKTQLKQCSSICNSRPDLIM